jgi:hypothetical protein
VFFSSSSLKYVILNPTIRFKINLKTPKVFSGATGDWQMHLRAAATLAPLLVRARITSTASEYLSSDCENRLQDIRFPPSEDYDAAIRLLLGTFIWFDILSCASTRSKPFLNLDYKLMLGSSGIHLEELMGCQNWAMVLIFDISVLDTWKKDSERGHRLSIAELAKRGAQIEERLNNKLAEISSQQTVFRSTEVTKIFALSALTYLHVVISGAHTELPEITESVSNTMAAFRALTDPKLLRCLVWPFCVTGCLASEGQQGFFRGLVSAAGVNEQTVGTCLVAFKLIEECWRIRKTDSRNCDWVIAMNNLGHHALLG